MSRMPLRLGNIEIADNENELPLSDLGSVHHLAKKEFPGGIVSIQSYGILPKPVSWSGRLYGTTAIGRAMELQDLCDNAQPITLQWAGWSLYGVIKSIKLDAHNQWEIPYHIEFEPAESNRQSQGFSVPALDSSGLLANALDLISQQTTNPATGYQFPQSVSDPVTQAQQQASNALQQNQNNLNNLSASTISQLRGYVSQARSSLQSLLSNSSPQAASAAADLNNTLKVLDLLLSQTAAPLAVCQTTNPNLYILAARYYDDSSLWYLIAEANGLSSPFPGGDAELIIPAIPASTTTKVKTLL